MLIRDSVKYVLTDEAKKIARKTDVSSDIYCTIIGDTSIPKGKTVSWTIYCKSIFDSEGEEFFVGVAPASVDQKSTTARYNSGWYLCWGSGTLFSGPPHKYVNKHYCMPRGVYVGSTVGLIMSTKERTGTLSFVFNGTDEGFAYEGIPLDKPLVPAVLLHYAGDSVEIV